MEKMLFFDIDRALYADVRKYIVGGRLLVEIKVRTNVRIVSATSNILVNTYYDSLQEDVVKNLHNKGGANLFSVDDDFYTMFTVNLN